MGITIKDGVDAFKRIQELSWSEIVVKDGETLWAKYHPQGIAITKNRYFLACNNEDRGIIYEYDRTTTPKRLVKKHTNLGAPGFGHPGCIQAADHILIVASQRSDFTGADIALYNTEDLQGYRYPIPTGEKDRIGSAGIALYEVNGNVRKYMLLLNYYVRWLTVTDGNLETATLSPCVWIEGPPGGLPKVQSESLIVDCNQNIFLIAAQSLNRKNMIQLHRIYQSDGHYKSTVVDTKEVGPGDWADCDAAVGIEVIEDSIKLYVTNKPALHQTYVYISQSDCFAAEIRRDSEGINGVAPLELIAFDYEHSGLNDYLLARLKDGHVRILKHTEGDHFETVYEDDPQSGLGGYGPLMPHDQILAFDYDKTGKQDHLVIYRPGDRRVWILRHHNNRFEPVFQSEDGIGGYDLRAYCDRAFVYDYDGQGKLDHLVFFRPGGSRILIIRHDGSHFYAVYNQNHIGGYDLDSEHDMGFAFDYNCSGRMDHIAFYRPGSKRMWILKREGDIFRAVYYQDHRGIGNFDLFTTGDRAFAFGRFGLRSTMILYRPGTDVLWMIGTCPDWHPSLFYPDFKPFIRCHQIPGHKISLGDKVIPFDFSHAGTLDHWIVYNSDNGKFWVYKRY